MKRSRGGRVADDRRFRYRPRVKSPLRLALAQTVCTPGDIPANAAAAARIVEQAADRGAHLVGFPELALVGYELALLAKRPDAWLTADDPRLDPVRRVCQARQITAVLGAALRVEGRPMLVAP